MVHVVLTGGGTAGHTSPLLATAEALRQACPAVELTCVGTPKGLETSVIPAAGLDLRLIPPVPLPRRLTPELLKVPWRLHDAVRQAGAILADVKADVVVGFGGYVSLPVYLAARRAKLPVVLHEQNALPGLANKVAARFAVAVLTSFPSTPLPRAQCTGLPVRQAVAGLAAQGRAGERAAARAGFGLPLDGPCLLVSGGSQGARRLNQAATGARDDLLAAGISLLHVWGKQNFPVDAAVVENAGGARYVPLAFVDDMALAYAAADLMLARAGAATVTETALVGLPGLFVPLPHGNGEQRRNAAPLIAAGAGLEIDDDALTPARLLAAARPLLQDPARLAAMGQAAQRIVRPGAAQKVAGVVLAVAVGRPGIVAEPGAPTPGGRAQPGTTSEVEQ